MVGSTHATGFLCSNKYADTAPTSCHIFPMARHMFLGLSFYRVTMLHDKEGRSPFASVWIRLYKKPAKISFAIR